MRFGGSRACTLNLPSRNPQDAEFVLFGNSHAQMYAPIVEAIAAERQAKGILVPMNGCLPLLKVNVDPVCAPMARLNIDEIDKLPAVKMVVLGLTWQHDKRGLYDDKGDKLTGNLDEHLKSAIDDVVDRYERKGIRVIVIGPIAYPGWDIASIMSSKARLRANVRHADVRARCRFQFEIRRRSGTFRRPAG